MRYVNQTFNDEAIDVDGNQFHRCTFNRCKIIFNGKAGTEFVGCLFNQCDWVFDKGAEETLQYLAGLYSGLGPGGQNIVEAVFDSIRQGGVGHGALQEIPVPAAQR